jgi:acyl-CoA thioesterase
LFAKERKAEMDASVKTAIFEAAAEEPFAVAMGMRLVHLTDGHSVVEMQYRPGQMGNIYQRAHGGAIFALVDEAFETSSQTEGTIAVALNVNVTYVSSPQESVVLRAESKRVAQTRKTATYEIRVCGPDGELVALCQALAYRTGRPIPFLDGAGGLSGP